MRFAFLSHFFQHIGLDIGSDRVRIWQSGRGLVLDEPTRIAVDRKNKRVIAVGTEALEMEGRVADHIVIVRPIKNAEIYDIRAAQTLIKILLQKAYQSRMMFNPVMLASVPAGVTPAAQETMTKLLFNLGAKEAYTIAAPLAASIGAGVPIADASGSFILHMGAGMVEGAVISLGSLVNYDQTRYAGDHLTNRLRHRLKKSAGLMVSLNTTERLKKEVVSILQDNSREKLVGGQDLKTGSPKELTINADLVYSEVEACVKRYETVLRQLLSSVPPELTVDMIDKGLLLSGGLAQLHGLDQYLTKKLGITTSVVDDPEEAVIKGIGTVIEHLDEFVESLAYQG